MIVAGLLLASPSSSLVVSVSASVAAAVCGLVSVLIATFEVGRRTRAAAKRTSRVAEMNPKLPLGLPSGYVSSEPPATAAAHHHADVS